jgi:hypothetical protein
MQECLATSRRTEYHLHYRPTAARDQAWTFRRVPRCRCQSSATTQAILYLLNTFAIHYTMTRAESSKDAANNGVKASAQSAPSNYELPW